MSAWESFFVAEVGASAVLAGLVFVGLSINLDKIIAGPGLPGRALEALVVLIVVLVVSSLLLVPGQSQALIGCEVLVSGLAVWIAIVSLQLGNLRTLAPPYRVVFAVRVALGQLATVPFVIAGTAVLVRGEGGLYWVVPGIIVSLVLALQDAWVLLVEINR
jgi:modulator of FtsH protease